MTSKHTIHIIRLFLNSMTQYIIFSSVVINKLANIIKYLILGNCHFPGHLIGTGFSASFKYIWVPISGVTLDGWQLLIMCLNTDWEDRMRLPRTTVEKFL